MTGPPSPAPRDAGLDAARALCTLGVVIAHATISYLTTPIGWAIRDGSQAQVADLSVWTFRQFLMPAFFLLSGWLGGRTFARLGPHALVVHRARRLVVPLALFLVPVSMAMNGLWNWGRACARRDAVAETVPAFQASTLPVTLGHLWYLYYLIWLTAGAVVVAAAWRRAPARWRAQWGALVGAVDRRGLTALVLTGPTAIWLTLGHKLQLDTPLDFVPDLLILAYFGTFFAWGWWLGPVAGAVPRWRAPIAYLAAAGAIAALVPPLIASVDGAAPPAWALGLAALSSWLLVTGLIDACRAWRAPPAWLGRFAVGSFWTYVVHLPLVVLLQLGAAQLDLPGVLEVLAIVAIALAASLGSFALIRRTWLGRLVA